MSFIGAKIMKTYFISANSTFTYLNKNNSSFWNLQRINFELNRLKQFDLNGTFEVFGSISVECKADIIEFDVHPNPAGSNVTIVLYEELPEGSTSLSFFDI